MLKHVIQVRNLIFTKGMKSKWCPNLGTAIQLYTQLILAHTVEHLIQIGLFSQCSKASITARVGILLIQSITAAQHGTSRQCS